MKPNRKLSRIFSFILLVGMLLLFGGVASAKDATAQCKGTEVLQTTLDQMVKEGTITKAKAEEVKTYFDKKHEEWRKHHAEMKKLSPEERKALRGKWRGEKRRSCGGVTRKLVQDKILTQEQADLLRVKLRETMWQQKQQRSS